MTSALPAIAVQARAAIDLGTLRRGDTGPAARALGIGRSRPLGLRNGSARMAARTARRILEKAREEELALAARIGRELDAHWHEGGEAP